MVYSTLPEYRNSASNSKQDCSKCHRSAPHLDSRTQAALLLSQMLSPTEKSPASKLASRGAQLGGDSHLSPAKRPYGTGNITSGTERGEGNREDIFLQRSSRPAEDKQWKREPTVHSLNICLCEEPSKHCCLSETPRRADGKLVSQCIGL